MNPAPPATARLFIALWPDAETRHAIAAWRDRWAWPAGAAVVADDRLHLTLHFIGPVERARLPEIESALAAVRCPPFELTLGGAAIWPRGLALWVPQALPEAARALHTDLAAALRALALPVEDPPWRPHATLARKAAGALSPPEPLALRWAVRDFGLAESHQGYRVLARLGAA
jgi:2'-5' RNA ligase